MTLELIGIIANTLRDVPTKTVAQQARAIADSLAVNGMLAPAAPPKGCICPAGTEATCRRGDCGRGV